MKKGTVAFYQHYLFHHLDLSDGGPFNCHCANNQHMIEKVNLPFQLGELTGSYVDKTDKVLGEMVTILGNILQA